MVVAEETAETFSAFDVVGCCGGLAARGSGDFRAGFDQLVIQPLVIAFLMIMDREFFEAGSQGSFAEEDHFLECFRF